MAGEVEVINTLGPKNAGTFPIAKSLETLGGFKSVANNTARDAIPAARREEGMWVRTNDTGKIWALGAGLTNGDWAEVVFGGTSGSARFLVVGAAAQFIYVNPTTGNDTTGNGLTAGTAYATIQRAINDIPDRFVTDVVVQLAAGSFAGQNVSVSVLPGFRTGSTTANIYITGDQTSLFTFVSSGAGTLVAGKAAQVTFNVAHGLTIADATHWLMTSVAGAAPATTRVLRASSTTQIVSVQSSTIALANQKICAFGTTFTGSFACGAAAIGPGGAPFVHLVGLKLDAPGVMNNVTLNGSRANGGTWQNCNVFSGVLTAAASFFDGDYGRRTMFNLLALATVILSGARSSCQQCVFTGSGASPALSIGANLFTFPTVPGRSPGSGVQLAQALDFEGSGVGILVTANGFFIASGTLSFALTNRILQADLGALVAASSASTWNGTCTLPAQLRRKAWFAKNSITFNVSNTATPGSDFDVGAAASVLAASGSVVDLSDLASYQ